MVKNQCLVWYCWKQLWSFWRQSAILQEVQRTYVRFFTSFDEHKAQWTREEAKSGRWSTASNDCPLDLFDGLDSGTTLFLPENFPIMFCAMLYWKSNEVNEVVDAILLKTMFELTTAISRKSKKKVEAKLTSTINFIGNLHLIAEVDFSHELIIFMDNSWACYFDFIFWPFYLVINSLRFLWM